MSGDNNDFLDAMGDVAPLPAKHQRGSAQENPASKQATLAQLERREAALGNTDRPKVDPNPLSLAEVPQLEPRDILEWKKDGVQHEVFHKLKSGKYPVEGTLDLHRLTVKEARAEVYRFFRLATARNWRTVLLAHGRGEKSSTPARLKSYVAFWLGQLPEVIAYHSADPGNGGTGAVLVLVKKSRKAKEETRESFGHKSSDESTGAD
jgi:DNA-nicking Smr family endonuclease